MVYWKVDLNQLEDSPQQDYASYVQRSKKLLAKILTSINEFQITILIKKLFPQVEFTDDKGKPDLLLDINNKEIRIDVKQRLPEFDLNINSNNSVEISLKSLLALLCKDAYPPIADCIR